MRSTVAATSKDSTIQAWGRAGLAVQGGLSRDDARAMVRMERVRIDAKKAVEEMKRKREEKERAKAIDEARVNERNEVSNDDVVGPGTDPGSEDGEIEPSGRESSTTLVTKDSSID
jgi:hypothetical protein